MTKSQETLQDLEARIQKLELRLKEAKAQRRRDWDLIDQIADDLYVAEQDRDVILAAERLAKELREIEDWYDDDKNRDAYTMSIIDLEFADVAK